VSASTATAVTLVPATARDAGLGSATVTTIVVNGTGFSGIVVGERLTIRMNAM
jgi:hypothetical protein